MASGGHEARRGATRSWDEERRGADVSDHAGAAAGAGGAAAGRGRAAGARHDRPLCVLLHRGAKAGERITESGYNHAWRKARVAAGCPGRIPHDFRRTAVRNSVRAGVPERVAMQMSGHKTRAVFERYNIVSPNDFRDAAERLDRYASGAS